MVPAGDQHPSWKLHDRPNQVGHLRRPSHGGRHRPAIPGKSSPRRCLTVRCSWGGAAVAADVVNRVGTRCALGSPCDASCVQALMPCTAASRRDIRVRPRPGYSARNSTVGSGKDRRTREESSELSADLSTCWPSRCLLRRVDALAFCRLRIISVRRGCTEGHLP